MTDGMHASIRHTARLAGVLYLSLAPLGFFSFVYVPSVLLVRGDGAATARNILASEELFRAGTVSHLGSQILVVFLVLAMYRLLQPVDRERALLMVVLGLVCVPISFVAEVNHLAALRLLSGGADAAFTAPELQAQAMLFLDLRQDGVVVAQVFWGLWSLPLSFLVFRSGFLPRPLCLPVLIAGAGYLIDSGTQLLLPGHATISQFTFPFELLLPLWLLIKGVNAERWQQVAGIPQGADGSVYSRS